MTTPTTAIPQLLTDPGFLLAAPLGSALPDTPPVGGVFTAAWDIAWVNLGPTAEGSTFSYASTVEPIRAAELFDPVRYATTERSGNIAFNLIDYTLRNLNLALNGGVGALVPTSGTGETALYTLEPPDPGEEVRVMIGWEALDRTVRLVGHQTMQGGEISTAFQRAPSTAAIPCTFNFEVPPGGKPWTIYGVSSRA
jgi:hypothetical protein